MPPSADIHGFHARPSPTPSCSDPTARLLVRTLTKAGTNPVVGESRASYGIVPYNGGVPKLPRDEAEALLRVRSQLGDDFEPALVDSFVDRIDEAIETRVAQHLRRALEQERRRRHQRRSRDDHALALAIVSLGVAIPLTAIASESAGFVGVLVAWLGIVLVNVVYGLGWSTND